MKEGGIDRDESGKVIAIYNNQQRDGQEILAEVDPAIVEYYAGLQKRVDEYEVKAKLLEIDRLSIRSIREYLSSLPDAPEYLKAHEAAAIQERAKLK
jgi:hypothetical protein